MGQKTHKWTSIKPTLHIDTTFQFLDTWNFFDITKNNLANSNNKNVDNKNNNMDNYIVDFKIRKNPQQNFIKLGRGVNDFL